MLLKHVEGLGRKKRSFMRGAKSDRKEQLLSCDKDIFTALLWLLQQRKERPLVSDIKNDRKIDYE